MIKQDLASYTDFAEVINSWLREADTVEAKLDMLDFAAEIIRNEWVAFSHAKALHNESDNLKLNCLPIQCFDKSGNAIEYRSRKRMAEISFSETPTAVSVWSAQRFVRAISDVRANGFIYSERFHIDYFHEIDAAYVTQGNHHCAAAVYLATGKAYASVISFRDLYAHLTTDGKKWYNAHTNEMLGAVTDWRFAVLYSVKRVHWQLENGDSNVQLNYAYAPSNDEYLSDRTLSLEQLVRCVKNHRVINSLSLRVFAKTADISWYQAFMFEHCCFAPQITEKIKNAVGLAGWRIKF